MSKILVIQSTCKRTQEEIEQEQERILKGLKENEIILLKDCYYKYEVVEVDDIQIKEGMKND